MGNRGNQPDFGGDVKSPLRRFGPPAILILVALLFVFQNTEQVSFDFFTFTFTFPLWTMLVVFGLLGAFVGWWVRRGR